MGDVIDFAEKQKGRRKKKAFSIPPILRKFRVHAIRLLASIIKSGSYSVAYIAGDIGYKSIYNSALLLILLTVINILAGVYLNKLLRTKQ